MVKKEVLAVISVCMTTYNGIKYIEEQLDSIVNQLTENDELLIFDDRSNDGTFEFILEYASSKPIVKIHQNEENLGYVKNFELAISSAKGDLILLSDQDDIWHENKVEFVTGFFNDIRNSSFNILHHGMETIDEKGNLLSEVFNYVSPEYNNYGATKKTLSTLIRPKCYGCAIAFRKDALEFIIPFPSIVYSHDHWLNALGVVSSSIYFESKILISYRQHGYNLSPKSGLNIFRKILVRLKLCSLFIISFIRQ